MRHGPRDSPGGVQWGMLERRGDFVDDGRVYSIGAGLEAWPWEWLALRAGGRQDIHEKDSEPPGVTRISTGLGLDLGASRIDLAGRTHLETNGDYLYSEACVQYGAVF